MSPLLRVYHSFRGAFFWDNPWELLLDYHLLRRSDPIRLKKGGLSLIVNYRHADMQGAKDVLLDGMYDNAFQSALAGSRKEREFRYLNLGANIGAFDLRAMQMAKSQSKKISGVAVEMNTANFARLVLNLEINGLLAIRPVNAALADEDGEIACELDERSTGQKAGDSPRGDPPHRNMPCGQSAGAPFGKAMLGRRDLISSRWMSKGRSDFSSAVSLRIKPPKSGASSSKRTTCRSMRFAMKNCRSSVLSC